jgi:nucleoid-associated protein YgaU
MEEALRAQRSSPDMTHTVRVKAGDTLPLLCQRIYRDASKYLEIARLNDLDGFRALAPGSELQFPPMR